MNMDNVKTFLRRSRPGFVAFCLIALALFVLYYVAFNSGAATEIYPPEIDVPAPAKGTPAPGTGTPDKSGPAKDTGRSAGDRIREIEKDLDKLPPAEKKRLLEKARREKDRLDNK